MTVRFLVLIHIFTFFAYSPVYSQSINRCGEPPALPMKAEEEEKFKTDAKLKAQALTRYVGSVDFEGAVTKERKTIFQDADKISAAQRDAYLAYIFCTIILEDKSLSTSDKLKSIQEFRKPYQAPKNLSRAFPIIDAVDVPISRDELNNLYQDGSWILLNGKAIFSRAFRAGKREFIVNYEGSDGIMSKINLYSTYEYTRRTNFNNDGSNNTSEEIKMNSKKDNDLMSEPIQLLCDFSDVINRFRALGWANEKRPTSKKTNNTVYPKSSLLDVYRTHEIQYENINTAYSLIFKESTITKRVDINTRYQNSFSKLEGNRNNANPRSSVSDTTSCRIDIFL